MLKLPRILAGFPSGCLPLFLAPGGLETCEEPTQGVPQIAALEDAWLERKTSLSVFFASALQQGGLSIALLLPSPPAAGEPVGGNLPSTGHPTRARAWPPPGQLCLRGISHWQPPVKAAVPDR